MAQMPDSFKPIDMPDSFQPISVDEPRQLGPIDSFISKRLNQLSGEEPGILNPIPSKNPVIDKPLLPELQHPKDEGWLGWGARGLYNSLIRPMTSPTGILGSMMGSSPVEYEPIKLPEVPEPKLAIPEGLPKVEPQLDLPLNLEPKTPLDKVLQRVHDQIPVDETGMKIYNPEGVRSLEVPGITPEIKPKPEFILPESTQKLRAALKESIPLNRQQRELYRVERSEKFAKAADVSVEGESDLPKFFSALKGPHTKVDITPLRESLEQTDIDSLLKTIRRSNLSQPEQANAFDGLQNLLDGRVPTDYDIQQLGKVFGEDAFSNMNRPMTMRRLITGVSSNFKGMKSAGDFGTPFRQGANYVGRESWFKSIIPMMKSYGSQRIFDEKMAFIKEHPFFETARDKMKIAFTDLASNREENAVGKIVGNLPLVKQSNRAATIFSNNMRLLEAEKQYNTWKTAYDTGMRLAKSPEELSAAKMLNPDNPYIAAKLGDRINTATGRGKLPGNLEKIAEDLNAVAFSPRLMASRVRSINRILNPVSYKNYNAIERRDALKQLASLAAIGMGSALTTKMIYKLAGYEPTIETSPDSTDFMKVKIDNTRYDPWGGYQQYFVPFFKVGMGTYKPTSGGDRRDLNKGAFAPGGFGTLERSFVENKLSPVAGLGATLLNRGEMAGRPLNLTSVNPFENTLTRALANPIIIQDLYDVLNEDPYLGPLLIPDMFGQSVQVYEHK